MKCHICNKEIINHKGMSYHFRISHSLDYIQYLLENNLIIVPKCLNCGNNIDILHGRGRVLILNNPNELKYCSNECKKNSDEYRKKMSIAGIKGGKLTKGRIMPENEKKIKSVKTKESWINLSVRNKRILGMKGKKNTEDHNKKISNALRGIKRTIEYKNKMSEIISNKYINGDYRKHKVIYNTIKCKKKEIYLMSSYEFKFAILLDLMPNVISWEYNSFYLYDDIKQKRYLPDFTFVLDTGDKFLVEIDKYKGFKERYGYGWKLKLAEKYCKENNMIFLYYDLLDINKMFQTNFPKINLSQINIKKQKNFEYCSIYISELLSQSKILIDNINVDFKQINSIIDDDFVTNTMFSINNNNYLLTFYENFWKCKWNYARFSPIEALNYMITLKTIIKNIIKNNDLNYKSIIQQLKKEKYAISFFLDSWALWIYNKFIKTDPIKILDISGGFGGRIMGFYQYLNIINNKLNYEYVYIDANNETACNTKKLVDELKMKNVRIINDRFENTNIFNEKFDIMFTSIPYYDLEQYNDIKLNEIYGDKYSFINIFINNIFKLNCDILILNVSEKYSDLINNKFINYNNFKQDKILKLQLTKHPFHKHLLNNIELFYVYKSIS